METSAAVTTGTHADTQADQGPNLDTVRARRVQLRKALGQLERALAGPSGRPEWRSAVHAAFVRIAEEFDGHVAVTEGAGGLHPTVVTEAPRLVHAVDVLVTDHRRLADQIAGLVTDTAADAATETEPEQIRERATILLAALSRHRQRGADLIYEAYQTDIGGGD